MKSSREFLIELVAAILVLVVLGWFLIYPGGRRVVGDYRLMRDADHTTYKLDDTRQPENQRANQGAVVRIGWDKRYIVVRRLASAAQGTPWSNDAGWTVIDVRQHKTSRTMTDSDLAQRTDLSGIVTYSPDSAYAKGHWW